VSEWLKRFPSIESKVRTGIFNIELEGAKLNAPGCGQIDANNESVKGQEIPILINQINHINSLISDLHAEIEKRDKTYRSEIASAISEFENVSADLKAKLYGFALSGITQIICAATISLVGGVLASLPDHLIAR
jgi:hypothetical protein